MDRVYTATKKEGARERRTVGFESHDDACEWLESQIDFDPHIESWTTEQYSKLVYVDETETVVGYVQTIPMIDQYRESQPDVLTEMMV